MNPDRDAIVAAALAWAAANDGLLTADDEPPDTED